MLFGKTYLSCLPICIATNGPLDCRSATFWWPFCCDSDVYGLRLEKNYDTINKSNCVTPMFLYSGGYRLSVLLGLTLIVIWPIEQFIKSSKSLPMLLAGLLSTLVQTVETAEDMTGSLLVVF